MTLQTTKQESKNGGPYTKNEQEKRRNQVYELYFEKGFSAIKIAEDLEINRNTINSDIKLLFSQTSSHLGKDYIEGTVLKQLERLEIQRRRILDYLDPKDIEKSIKAEKILLEIEEKISFLGSRLVQSFEQENVRSELDISEKYIVKFVTNIVPLEFPCILSKNSLLERIIAYQKCSLEYAEKFIENMKLLGLELVNVGDILDPQYCISRFALMRGYISKKDNEMMKEKLDKEMEEEDRKMEELEKESTIKYGSDKTKWPLSILDELNN